MGLPHHAFRHLLHMFQLHQLRFGTENSKKPGRLMIKWLQESYWISFIRGTKLVDNTNSHHECHSISRYTNIHNFSHSFHVPSYHLCCLRLYFNFIPSFFCMQIMKSNSLLFYFIQLSLQILLPDAVDAWYFAIITLEFHYKHIRKQTM